MERGQTRLEMGLEGPQDCPGVPLAQDREIKKRETTWAQPSCQPFLSPARGGQGAHTTEEDKPGVATPASPGHQVFRCRCWVDVGSRESGQGCFLGLFLQAFPGQQQPEGGGWQWGGGVQLVDGESSSGLSFMRIPGLRLGGEDSTAPGSLCWLPVIQNRVWARPGQSPKIWDRGAAAGLNQLASPSPLFSSQPRPFPNSVPLPPASCFPLAPPPRLWLRPHFCFKMEMDVYPSASSELAWLRKSQCPLSPVPAKHHSTLREVSYGRRLTFLNWGLNHLRKAPCAKVTVATGWGEDSLLLGWPGWWSPVSC